MKEWLRHNAIGYAQLSELEKNAIMSFSLLWSLFEAQVLNYSASVRSIQTKINDWDSQGLLKIEDFEKFKEYLRKDMLMAII